MFSTDSIYEWEIHEHNPRWTPWTAYTADKNKKSKIKRSFIDSWLMPTRLCIDPNNRGDHLTIGTRRFFEQPIAD